MFPEQPDATHHLLPRRLVGCRAAIFVMKFLWAVNGDAYKPVMLFEKFAPLIGKQRAIGLYRIVYLPAKGILLLQCDRFPVE